MKLFSSIRTKPYIGRREIALARMRVAGYEGDESKRATLMVQARDVCGLPALHEAWMIGAEKALAQRGAHLEAERQRTLIAASAGVYLRG